MNLVAGSINTVEVVSEVETVTLVVTSGPCRERVVTSINNTGHNKEKIS